MCRQRLAGQGGRVKRVVAESRMRRVPPQRGSGRRAGHRAVPAAIAAAFAVQGLGAVGAELDAGAFRCVAALIGHRVVFVVQSRRNSLGLLPHHRDVIVLGRCYLIGRPALHVFAVRHADNSPRLKRNRQYEQPPSQGTKCRHLTRLYLCRPQNKLLDAHRQSGADIFSPFLRLNLRYIYQITVIK